MIKRILRISCEFSHSFWVELSSILSYFFTLGAFLGHSSIHLDLEKEGKGKLESARLQLDQQIQLDCFANNRLHV